MKREDENNGNEEDSKAYIWEAKTRLIASSNPLLGYSVNAYPGRWLKSDSRVFVLCRVGRMFNMD